MSIKSSLNAFLNADAGIAASVLNRIYPVSWPEDSATPLITYQRMPNSPHDTTLTKSVGTSLATFTLTAIASDYGTADTTADAVRTAMLAFSGTMGTTTVDSVTLIDDYDEFFPPVDGGQRGLYAVVLEFRIRYHETVVGN